MGETRIAIIAKPGSKTASITVGDRGIIVAVREPAREGEANDACRHALAKALRVAPSCVVLVSGARSKRKLFGVDGLTKEAVMARLAAERAT